MSVIDIINHCDVDDNLEMQYNQMLDDIYPEIIIGNSRFNSSKILKELDYTTYRCGFIKWLDSLELRYLCSECKSCYDDYNDADNCCKEQT